MSSVVSLGRFRLKNVGRPFELYAVSADGVVVPDPRALEGKGERFASLPSNLPDPATPLLGRAADLASLVELVARTSGRHDHRSGRGREDAASWSSSAGCSRPSSWTASRSSPLADVTEPEDFVPALADALDVKEAEERTLGDGIVVAHR